jgi:hypothetical protein
MLQLKQALLLARIYSAIFDPWNSGAEGTAEERKARMPEATSRILSLRAGTEFR